MTEQEIIRFLEAFDLKKYDYENKVRLDGPDVGFSILKRCDESTKFKLRIEKGKEYVTLIYVFLAEEDLKSASTRVPIHLRAKFLLKTQDGFTWQYDYIGNKRCKPVDLESFDEYYYDVNSHKFYRDGEISPEKIVDQIYRLHMKPTCSFRGFKLRTKLSIQKISI